MKSRASIASNSHGASCPARTLAVRRRTGEPQLTGAGQASGCCKHAPEDAPEDAPEELPGSLPLSAAPSTAISPK